MHFQALQKKATETKRQEKKTEVKQKDGTVKVIQKYKRKKRFGRSINRRAPARFLLKRRYAFFLHRDTVKPVRCFHRTASVGNDDKLCMGGQLNALVSLIPVLVYQTQVMQNKREGKTKEW